MVVVYNLVESEDLPLDKLQEIHDQTVNSGQFNFDDLVLGIDSQKQMQDQTQTFQTIPLDS